MEQLNEILTLASLVITIIAVPVAIILHFKEKRRERLDREYGTYDALDDKYLDFLKLCLEYSHLNIFGDLPDLEKKITDSQRKERLIIYEILVCLLERAYLMYQGHNNSIRSKQWNGWVEYINYWFENKNFKESWNDYLNSQYDKGFISFMNDKAHA